MESDAVLLKFFFGLICWLHMSNFFWWYLGYIITTQWNWKTVPRALCILVQQVIQKFVQSKNKVSKRSKHHIGTVGGGLLCGFCGWLFWLTGNWFWSHSTFDILDYGLQCLQSNPHLTTCRKSIKIPSSCPLTLRTIAPITSNHRSTPAVPDFS